MEQCKEVAWSNEARSLEHPVDGCVRAHRLPGEVMYCGRSRGRKPNALGHVLLENTGSGHKGLEGSAANVLVPGTIGHLQRSSKVCASRVRDVLATHGGPRVY